MLNKILVVATKPSSGKELVSKANELAAQTVLVTCVEGLTGTDVVYTFSDKESVVTKLKAIADLAAELQPELVLCEANRGGRLVAGYVAAVLKTCPLPESLSIEVGDGKVTATRMVHGGGAIMTETVPFPVVAAVGEGLFEVAEGGKASEVKELGGAVEGVELLDVKIADVVAKNLPGAKKVVGVGRGLGSADNLPLVDKFASLIGAEVGCTRPAAEEENWFPRSDYIGVSGLMLKPPFYFAMGISGAVQHMVGVDASGVIFALDKNENAPIFDQSDYCLVGRIETALPKIIEALEG